MADTSNLTNFLGDIADAIRTKKSTTEEIPAANFDTEILSIDTIKGQEKTIIPSTTEQIVTPDGDYNAITKATVKAVDNTIDSNISPENIKKNINILGVTGTLEEGEQINNQDKEITTNGTYTANEGYTGLGTVTVNVPQEGGSGDVKLFETEEAMQADTTVQEGDLAVVYGSEIQNATVDSQFSSAMFPATVVLPEAITDYVDIMYRATDDSVMFECWGQLDSSRFMMDCYTESGEIRIQYESSDGITYTRTDGGDATIDFGTEIHYEYAEMWNDAIGKFIQVGGSTFGGLFVGESIIKQIQPIKMSTMTINAETGVPNISDVITLNYNVNNFAEKIYPMVKYIDTLEGMNSHSRYPYCIYLKDNNTVSIIADGRSSSSVMLACPVFVNNTFKGLVAAAYDVTNFYEWQFNLSTGEYIGRNDIVATDYTTFGSSTSKYYYTTAFNDYYYVGNMDWTGNNFNYLYSLLYNNISNSANTFNTLAMTGIIGIVYFLAPTQLTLNNPNELLPGKIAYGKNGIVEGDESIYEQIPKSINIKNVLGYIPDKDNMECIGTIDGEYGKGTLLASTKLDELDNISNRLQLRYVTNTILDNVKTKINEYMGTTNYSYTFEGSTDTYLYFYYRDGGSNTGKVIYYMCRYNKITNQFDGKNVFTAATFTVAQYQYYMSSYFYKVPNTHNCYDFIYPNNEEKTYCVNINFDNMTAKTVYAWSSRDTQVCEGGCCTIGDYLYGFYYQYSNKVFRIKLSTNTMTLNVYSNSASGYPMYYRPQVAIKNGIPYIVFWFASQMVLFKLSSDGSSITSTKTIFTTSSTKYANNMTQFDYGDDTYFLTSDTYNFGSEFQGFKLALNGSTELLTGWNISSLPSTYEQHNTNVYFKQINDIIYCASINSATLYKIDVLNKTTTVSKYHTNTITSNYTYIYNCYNTKLKEIDDMKRIYTVEQYDGETVHEVTLLCYLGYGYTLFNNVKELYSIITKLNDKCKIVYKSSLENLLPDYTDTITPTEYNTAIDTANEILGEEV